MLTLNDGRSELWQWDTGRTLAVDADCSQVHFSNNVFGRSIDVDVADGIAIIPDILLQTDKDLNVWAFVGTAENGYTKISKTFKVNRRNKPADYVFTHVEQTTLAELSGRLDRIEESQDPDAIKNAVDDYLAQNPVEAPVQSVNGHTGAVELNAEDVGAIAETELQTAINTALEQAKASGEFDGADGKDGADGIGIQSVEQTVTSTEDGGTNVITVTKTDGTSSTFAVKNGSKGSTGATGAAGQDGHSPVVTATKSGKTTTISVDGSAIATVEDGADGKPGAAGQAGASGADGITPTIGPNGNWYLGEEDTGKTSRGATGAKGDTGATGPAGPAGPKGDTGPTGADGKSAYQYAQDGGYTGTEAEFTEKLAQEPLIGTTNDITPTQVYDAVSAGIPVKVQYFDNTFGILAYTNFSVAENMNMIAANLISLYFGNYILGELLGDKTNNTWSFITTTLAEKADIPDIPTALPNPNAMTFTGAVTGSYDGSNAKTVNIPSAVTDDHINSLIDTKLGVIENGAY